MSLSFGGDFGKAMDTYTRIGIYVVIVASSLLGILLMAFGALKLGRWRAKRRFRQRRLLSPASSTSAGSGSGSAEAVFVLPVLPHPEGVTSTPNSP